MENNQEVVTATTENAGVETETTVPSEETKPVVDKTTEKNEQKQGNEERKFTQAEVDKMIESRLARQEKKDINVDLQKELEKVKNELNDYKQELSIKNAKVSEEYKDFVKFQVSKMVSNEKDFDTALKEYMAGDGKKFETQQQKEEQPKIVMTRPANVGADDEKSSIENMLSKAMKI